ncbi:MAG: hypothetical protein ACE5KM_24215 [Planctomycetaceae bacterium]
MKRSISLATLVILTFVVDSTMSRRLTADVTVKPAAAEKPAPAAKAYLLRYKFTANKTVHYRVSHRSTIKMVKGTTRGTAVNEAETQKHYTVVAIDRRGNAILEPVIDWVKMSAQFDEQPKKSYDSRTDQTADRRFAGVAKTVGKVLVQLKVTPRGELLKAAPQIPGNVQKAVVKNAGPPRPANDASKNFLILFPGRPVRVGESWMDDSLTVSLQVGAAPRVWQRFTILRRYELVSVEDGKATLELSMTPEKPVNDPRLQVQLVQRLISGTIVFDLRKGVIVSRRLTADRKILGFAGNQSILHVKSLRTERLLTRKEVARAATSSRTK